MSGPVTITLESTAELVRDPPPARVWQGRGEDGVPMMAFITIVAGGPHPRIQQALERRITSTAVITIPLRDERSSEHPIPEQPGNEVATVLPSVGSAVRQGAGSPTTEDLVKVLTAAHHALRSYQFGNTAPELAREVGDRIVRTIATLEGR